ncbi:hypothetical protein [Domibacillus tundrae]|uniref:hypothetical protein n=1 Tax=Domibacillus tundrae TaxID=1587527 RepID=UPI000B2DB4AD|nr:hypothetical protein [Domibacillus tundrae]
MKTLEKYIKENQERHIHHHVLSVNGDGSIYIHPQGVDGDTIDFEVKGNELIPKR